MRIYTRTGDTGDTSLFGGGRVSKTHPRVRAYGAVDELNAVLGLARAAVGSSGVLGPQLKRVQNQLFDLGADLATPPGVPAAGHVRRVPSAWIRDLELSIDDLEASLPALTSFILPAGTQAAAALHMARTVCRRAERRCVAASAAGEAIGDNPLAYLNRLSDWLFVAARVANRAAGAGDEPWQPQAAADDASHEGQG